MMHPRPWYCGSSRMTHPRIAAATLRITMTQPSRRRGGSHRRGGCTSPSTAADHQDAPIAPPPPQPPHITSDRRTYIALWRVILGITMFVGLSKGNRESGGAFVRRVADVRGCMESEHPRLNPFAPSRTPLQGW